MYYLAGLLPDPEGPWTPEAPHAYAWVTGAFVETVISSVFVSTQPLLRVPSDLIIGLNALGWARIVVLVLMTGTLIFREYRLRPNKPSSVPEERQSLLENGNGNGASATYGSVPASAAASPRRTQVSGTGWLDYFVGFRVLFPYLWCD